MSDPGRSARRVGLAIVILAALAFCTLRIGSLRDHRDDAVSSAMDEIAAAIESPADTPDRFADAHTAATDAARQGSALLDPTGPFLVSLVERLEGAAEQTSRPGPDASVFARLDWLLAHGRLHEAAALLASVRDRDDVAPERVALYGEVLEALGR